MFIKILKGFNAFLMIVLGLILVDMLILGGKIKIFILALGNTSDYSPFSTDGQSNWCLILVILLFIIVISAIIYSRLLNRDEEE